MRISRSRERLRSAKKGALKYFAGAASLAALTLTAATAQAGYTANFGDGKSISIGLGLRGSFSTTEDAAPDGSWSSDFNLDSVRLYVNGSLTDSIKATFNTERDGDGHIRLLDGFARFEPMDEINVWAGRLLPPSDRANLDGPYYLNTWSYPGVVSQYPAKFAGRDDGVTVWGKLLDKKLVYAVGGFAGHNRGFGASNKGDNILYAGRITYNVFDPEDDPGYFTSSTYYGSADILAIGFAGMYQKNGVGTAATPGDYASWNVDVLFEKPLGADVGVVTLEGAYYQYDTDGVLDVVPGFGGAGSTDNVGGVVAGDAYLLGGAYLIPVKVGWGKFQPYVRYQRFEPDLGGYVRLIEGGVNYVIDGHNARISLDFSNVKTSATTSSDRFIAGVQLQF